MSRRDEIRALTDDFLAGRLSQKDFDRTVDNLMFGCGNADQTRKLRSAKRWAEIFYSPRKWEKWGSHNSVRSFVYQDLKCAEMCEEPPTANSTPNAGPRPQ